MKNRFTFGVIVNPIAGVGGPLGWRGSDDLVAVLEHARHDFPRRAGERFIKLIRAIDQVAQELGAEVILKTADGLLGEYWLEKVNLKSRVEVVFSDYLLQNHPRRNKSHSYFPSPDMFCLAARSIVASGIDLLLFVGGDGTARLLVDASVKDTPVLGIPAGVKMHSGVFAVSVDDAISLLSVFLQGQFTQVVAREVRDLDETAYRNGNIRTALYGSLWVPAKLEYVQATKMAGRENDSLVKIEIAAYCVDHWIDDGPVLIGPGTTAMEVKRSIADDGTLLGIDVFEAGRCIVRDGDEKKIWSIVAAKSCSLVLGVTAGHGIVIGRGNQPLSARILRAISPDRCLVIATKSKLQGLEHKCLRIDMDDEMVREQWSGTKRVLVGYDDWVLMPVR